jgi:hypothetical protein
MSRGKVPQPKAGPSFHSPREVRPFDVELSADERADLSARFAAADDDLEAALSEERERKKAVRERLDAIREAKRAIRAAMRSGIERRQVICEWSVRDGGARVLTRTDTGEVIEEQAQRVLE